MAVIAVRQIFTQPTKLGQLVAPATAAGKTYTVLLDMDPVDAANPAKYVSIRLEQRMSSTDPWRDNGGVVYHGGTYLSKDGITLQVAFGFTIAGSEIAGQQIRMSLIPGHGLRSDGSVIYAVGDTFNTGVTATVD